jgi:hypothetical protein
MKKPLFFTLIFINCLALLGFAYLAVHYFTIYHKEPVAMQAVRHNGLALKNQSELMRNDQHVVILAVQNNGLALQWASKPLKNNQPIVLAAVKQNGMALQYASAFLKTDPKIITTALKQNPKAIQFVPKALQKKFLMISKNKATAPANQKIGKEVDR